MKSIRDFNIKGKRILVRCDFNIPLDNNGNILDDFRIKAALPTIKYLLKNKARIILMSHLDPENQGLVSPKFSLSPVAKKLSELIGLPVKMATDCVGKEVKEKVDKLNEGEILLLENLKFHKGEKDNNEAFAKKLSELCDIYINDAFASCHRLYASIIGVPKYLSHGAGFLLEKEIENLEKILKNPEKPMIVLVGGKKVQDKVKFIERMFNIADFVIVSGLIKKELNDKEMSFERMEKLIPPEDDLESLDISDQAAMKFRQKILQAKTIVWNGPFGKFEDENYKKGTLAIANAIIESGAFSVVGGGETIEFLNKEGIVSKFNHVSTGGGAMLSYLSGEVLPGIKALQK